MAIHERIRYARERASLTGAQVRERTGIAESTLSGLEHGKHEPSISQLQALAKAYQRSLAFFLADGPLPSELVLWRKKPTDDASEIETRFLRLCEQYYNLEIWCDDHAPTKLPSVDGNGRTYRYADAEELARRVRQELGLGDRPSQELLPVLEESCGVKIFFQDFLPDGSAASTVSETFGAAILLSPSNVRWRRNHDLAHELFHLLTWRVFRDARGEQPDAHEEKLATCFARNLLMPPEAIRSAVNRRLKDGKLAMSAIFEITREFDVSAESLLWALLYVYPNQWKPEEIELQIEKTKAIAHLYQERPAETLPSRPARFRALATQSLQNGDLSIGRFAEYMGISRTEAMKYAEQEAADGAAIQVTPA